LNNEGGIKGFYKGISLNLLKAPLASATAWAVKNNLNRKLDKNYDF
jgi:solute carrier family 25 protein 42